METLTGLLLPPEVGPGAAALLVGTSFFTSTLTGALGLGGGLMMLALLATVLPPVIVIPVHGVVQIGSNCGRALLLRADVARGLLGPFALGSLVGVGGGALLVHELPKPLLLLLLGLFVLWACWSPRLRPHALPGRAFALVGLATSFVTMFLGATGPFVAAFLSPERLGRRGVVATHAACMTLQHGLKVGAFTALGFAFLPWVPLLLAMIGLGFLGTIVGTRLLDRLPERSFARAFRIVLTGLALKLLWDGARALALA